MTLRAEEIATRVEAFVRDIVVPYERDPRIAVHAMAPQKNLWQSCVQKRVLRAL